MQLVTERLILREFRESDWPEVLAYQQDPRYLRFNPWTERTPAEVQAFVQMFLDQQRAQPRLKYQLALTLKSNDQTMPITIRPAMEADQATITRLIRQARLNPRHLHWANFLMAEVDGQIAGLRQVKPHRQGTREVASGLVLPEYRHQGISAHLMQEILAREKGSLYLMCDRQWAAYYAQFGFERVAPKELPADFGREYRLDRFITWLLSLFARRKLRIIPMRRNGGENL